MSARMISERARSDPRGKAAARRAPRALHPGFPRRARGGPRHGGPPPQACFSPKTPAHHRPHPQAARAGQVGTPGRLQAHPNAAPRKRPVSPASLPFFSAPSPGETWKRWARNRGAPSRCHPAPTHTVEHTTGVERPARGAGGAPALPSAARRSPGKLTSPPHPQPVEPTKLRSPPPDNAFGFPLRRGELCKQAAPFFFLSGAMGRGGAPAPRLQSGPGGRAARGAGARRSPYLEVLEEGGDARDLQAEAPGGAAGALDAPGRQRLVPPPCSRRRARAAGQAAPGGRQPEAQGQGGPGRPGRHGCGSGARAPGAGRGSPLRAGAALPGTSRPPRLGCKVQSFNSGRPRAPRGPEGRGGADRRPRHWLQGK